MVGVPSRKRHTRELGRRRRTQTYRERVWGREADTRPNSFPAEVPGAERQKGERF